MNLLTELRNLGTGRQWLGTCLVCLAFAAAVAIALRHQ